MAKDPAFLFYSNDFYSGTRMMLPEERACYIDLLIYQHQNGIIPNNPKRLLMFCVGVDEATLKATLEAKFELTPDGWVNRVLEKVVTEREKYTKSQSESGKVGQFWKKAKLLLSKKDFEKLKKTIDKPFILKEYSNSDFTNEATLKALFKRCLNNKENEDVIENENEIKNITENEKGSMREKTKIQIFENEIIFPFETETFKAQWQLWKTYKNKEHSFKYKSPISEQGSLKKLSEMANNDEKTAIKIIHQSIENGWKGFFELKNNTNGRNNNTSATDTEHKESAVSAVGKMFGIEQ